MRGQNYFSKEVTYLKVLSRVIWNRLDWTNFLSGVGGSLYKPREICNRGKDDVSLFKRTDAAKTALDAQNIFLFYACTKIFGGVETKMQKFLPFWICWKLEQKFQQKKLSVWDIERSVVYTVHICQNNKINLSHISVCDNLKKSCYTSCSTTIPK